MMGESTLPRLVVVGASHRTSSARLRDALFLDPGAMPQFLDSLKGAGLGQAMVLSTCDRTEVGAVHADAPAAATLILEQFARGAGVARADLQSQCYSLSGRAALRHLFGVTSSLDSQIVGEPHVLGQVKESHRLASAAGMVGPELDSALQAAYRAAKRVRTETAIGERPVSIAAAAERLARNLHGELSGARGLLVGTGEMGVLIADHLHRAGLASLVVAARIRPQAEAVARQLGGHYALWEERDTLLEDADIVIAAAATGRHVVSRAMVEAALAARRRRPVFLIDAAAPGDIQPAVADLDDAFLYDLGDLEAVAMAGLARRDAEAGAAMMIVEEEVSRFLRERQGRAASPLVAALRAQFDAKRLAALRDAPDDPEAATRLLINRLLHGPSEALRRMAEDGADAAGIERMLAALFGIGRGEDEEQDR